MVEAAVLTSSERDRQSRLSNEMVIAWAIAVVTFLLHLYFNNRYGYFRDEFDYMSCGDHLQWGYVDQPPLIPFLIHYCRILLGDSLRAVRFIPALATSLLTVQGAALAREFGARRYAMVLTALTLALTPQYLSNGGLLGTNCLEPNLWMGCAYFFILAVNRNHPRYWVWFGVVAGIGLLEKYSILVFGLGMVVGLLLTEQRRVLLNRWIWLGGAAALLVFLPNLLWNIHYDWPFVQLMRAIRADGRDVVFGPGAFLLQQVLLVGPWSAPIWMIGLFALLFMQRLRPYRALGCCYLVCYAAFFMLHGKPYYLGPVYPMLLAAGAVVIGWALEARPSLGWLKPTIAVIVLANGIYLAPVVVPVLSPDRFLTYVKYLPVKLPVTEHSHAAAALPQWYSDQFGFKEIADAAIAAWDRIPASERADCGIFAQDYGQAGSVDFFGRAHGLPGAMSGDRTYFLWGPHNYSGNCMMVMDDRKEVLERYWQSVKYVATSAQNPYALERPVDVFICKGKKFESWAAVWPNLKRWR